MLDFSLMGSFFTMTNVFLMIVGTLGGIIVGAIPGLTPSMAVALLVPMTFGMPIEFSVVLLVSVYVGGISGGLLPACLLNIPGTPASVTTAFDAYPIVRQGHAGRALSFGILSSFIGGTISFFFLLFLAPTLGRVAISFGPYEYFALVVLTMCCIASISKKAMAKGLLCGALGIILSLLGMSHLDGVPRMTFGLSILENGLDEMPVLIGMYAVSQILTDIVKKDGTSLVGEVRCSLNDMVYAVKYVLKNSKQNILRSSLIGTFIGILPGIGPSLSNVVAYAQAKAASKQPELFGTGTPDGIIAPETANNATTGGALIPMLSLGIPGDVTTMMLLAAFTIHGVQPGPLLFREHADLVAVIMVCFLLSTLMMFVLQTTLMRLLVNALRIPVHVLYPIIISMCVIGCYSLNNSMFDVYTFLVIGFVGYVLTRLDFPMLPLLLGLLLGSMAESNFRAAYVHGGETILGFLERPIAMIFLACSVAFVAIPPILESRRNRKKAQA